MSGPTTPDGTDSDWPRTRTWGRTTNDGDGKRDRAVSELLGAILLFGLLVAVMVLLQANAVPSQNERIEFDHNQRVQGDVLELSSAVEDVAATGRDRSAILELSPEYPNRFLLLNPGRAQGRVTTSEADFTVGNAVATGETGDYWNGDARQFDSRAFEYVPSYNVYRNAPDTVLGHGTVTDRFPDGTVTDIGGSSLVDGRRISLVALDGQRNEARSGALSVELVPLSTETETVTVTDDGSGPVVLRLQTDLDAAEWREILESELAANGGFVADVRDGPGGTVELVFEQGETYQLRLAKVGVGSGVTDPDPAYLTARGSDAVTLEQGEERELTVQVRDPYNAPEPGVEVTFDASEGTLSGTTVVTDESGEATVTYTAGSADGTVTVTVGGGTGGADDPRSVVYDVTVDSGDGPDDGGEAGENDFINPSRGTVVLTDVVEEGGKKDGYVKMSFTNLGDEARTIDEARVNFLYSTKPGNDKDRPTNASISYDPFSDESDPLIITGKFVDVEDRTLTTTGSDETVEIAIRFYKDGDQLKPPNTDEFFVVTLLFDDGTTGTYFVQNPN